jgi:hypothetical protein
MTYLTDAKAHLDKAREFLDSAGDECDFDRYNAAVSAAVISGGQQQRRHLPKDDSKDNQDREPQ